MVREAISNLKASGLVSTHQGKGAFVLEQAVPSFHISEDKLALAEDLLEALEVRIAIDAPIRLPRLHARVMRTARPVCTWCGRNMGSWTRSIP